jgi:ribosomal protein L37AE/L43A
MVLCTPSRGLEDLRRAADSLDGVKLQAVLDRARDADGVPVSNWSMCPVCRGSIRERVEHAVLCGGTCGRCWADPGFEPVISKGPDDYRSLVGTDPWEPWLPSDLKSAGHTTAFMIRPQSWTRGPMQFPDISMNARILDPGGVDPLSNVNPEFAEYLEDWAKQPAAEAT